jgi:hypothetical protein
MYVESSWNVMAHGDAQEGKWRENWRMEWVASSLHATSEHGVSSILPLMRTPRLPVVDWTHAPVDLNGLVRFAERRNLVSARAVTIQLASTTCWNTETDCILTTKSTSVSGMIITTSYYFPLHNLYIHTDSNYLQQRVPFLLNGLGTSKWDKQFALRNTQMTFCYWLRKKRYYRAWQLFWLTLYDAMELKNNWRMWNISAIWLAG